MRVVHLSATAGPDGVLHLSVPVGAPGEFEVAVVVAPKPPAKTPEELGWPPGYFENVIGSVTDETFVAPPRSPAKPLPPLDDQLERGEEVRLDPEGVGQHSPGQRPG